MPKTEPDLRPLVESLTEAERAALPARLRRLTVDDRTTAWNQAKAERDAALAAAIDPETGAADADAIAATKAAWRARKAELGGEG